MFPTLETNRLILREITMSDRMGIYYIFSNREAMRYYGIEPIGSIDEASNLITTFQANYIIETGLRFGIVEKATNQLIGTIGLQQLNKEHRRCEVGYELHPNYWGRGFATEALQEVTAFTFLHTIVNRISAIIYTVNPQSERVVKKLGFQLEGEMKQYFFQNGTYYDCHLYSLLKDDWFLQNKKI